MDNNNNKTVVDPKLLNLMRKGIKNILYGEKAYKLLGRGGEGNVYRYDSKTAIKVYHNRVDSYDPIYREIYVVDFLRSIDQIRDHIANLGEFVAEPIPYMFSDLYGGDLDNWAKIATTKGTEATEEEWLSMIFQVTFAFLDINSRGVLHDDPKPKNIFYKREDNPSNKSKTYKVNGKTFKIPLKYSYYLGDFSHVRIAGLDPDYDEDLMRGAAGTPDLFYNLANRTDLYELSRILYRVLVNAVIGTFSQKEVLDLVKSKSDVDPDFKARIEKVEQDIRTAFPSNHPLKIRILNRAYVYELIESNYLTPDTIASKSGSIVLPSDKVQNILSRVADPDERLESIFNFYLQ